MHTCIHIYVYIYIYLHTYIYIYIYTDVRIDVVPLLQIGGSFSAVPFLPWLIGPEAVTVTFLTIFGVYFDGSRITSTQTNMILGFPQGIDLKKKTAIMFM